MLNLQNEWRPSMKGAFYFLSFSFFQPDHGDWHSNDHLQAWEGKSHMRTKEKLSPMKLYQPPYPVYKWLIFGEIKNSIIKQFGPNSTANWYACLKFVSHFIKKSFNKCSWKPSLHYHQHTINMVPFDLLLSSQKFPPKLSPSPKFIIHMLHLWSMDPIKAQNWMLLYIYIHFT